MWYLIVSIPDLCTLTYFSHPHLLSAFVLRNPGTNKGAPWVWGIWREWLFIFRELGSTGNLFQGFGDQAHSFRDLGSPAKKLKKSRLKGKAFISFDFFKTKIFKLLGGGGG